MDEAEVTDSSTEVETQILQVEQANLVVPADHLYKYGYSGNKKTKEQYLAWSSFQKIDPELARRILRMMECAAAVGKDIGVGGSWRSSEGQEKLFRSRYMQDSAGRTYWAAPNGDGPWWTKKDGVAAAAAPGKSYHESSTDSGKCLAADMIGDMAWMDANLSRFGMYNFNSELWHVQPKEIPAARTAGRLYPSPPQILLPAIPQSQKPIVSAPLPSLVKGNKGNRVNMLQSVINFWKWDKIATDGDFGPQTEGGVKKMQTYLKATVDGKYGPQTYGKYLEFVKAVMAVDPTK